VTDVGVGEQFARLRVMNHLVNIDRDAPVRLLAEGFGFDFAGDDRELSVPILPNRLSPDHSTPFPGVWPINSGMHQLDRVLDVAFVERVICGPQKLLFGSHATQSTERARFRFARIAIAPETGILGLVSQENIKLIRSVALARALPAKEKT
jgi:hypothetical protein